MIDIRNVGVFVKFIEPEYAADFLNEGEIHFAPLKYFINHEKNADDHVIGDKHEGEVAIKLSPDTLITVIPLANNKMPSGDKIVFKPGSSEIKLGLKKSDKEEIGIASFMYLSLKDCKFFRKDAENYYYLLKPSVIKQLKKFNSDNRKMVVIYDYFQFLKMSDNKEISRKLVEYYDNKVQETSKDRKYIEYAFTKSTDYKSQREYRLAVRLKKPSVGENIKIGSINSFSKIFNYDELAHLAFILSGPIRK